MTPIKPDLSLLLRTISRAHRSDDGAKAPVNMLQALVTCFVLHARAFRASYISSINNMRLCIFLVVL